MYTSTNRFTINRTLHQLKAQLLLRPCTSLFLRQTRPIPLPEPLIDFPFIPNLIVRLIIPLIQLTIVPFYVFRHIFSNMALFVDVGRLTTRAEGWSCFIGRLLLVVDVFMFFLLLLLLLLL